MWTGAQFLDRPEQVMRMAMGGFSLLCWLALPVLVADLVWVGLLHDGIGCPVPALVRADELAQAEHGLTSGQVELIEKNYSEPDAYGVRRFEGRPSQLVACSRLALALSGSRGRLDAIEALVAYERGISWTRSCYASLGMDLVATRWSHVVQAARSITLCLFCQVVLALYDAAFLWSARMRTWAGTGQVAVRHLLRRQGGTARGTSRRVA